MSKSIEHKFIMTGSFFSQIERLTQIERQRLAEIPVIAGSLQGDVQKHTYVAFLTEAYHHVKHTVPLLMACGSRLPERLEWLRAAVAHYIQEELGHQEWILNDIATLGGDAEAVRTGNPGRATELMVSHAYDCVTRGNPVGFFGMVYVLEKTSSTIATAAAQQIQSQLNLPNGAMSYMISHGSLDVKHMEEYADLVNQLDSQADREAIIRMALTMYQLYGDIFRGLPYQQGADISAAGARDLSDCSGSSGSSSTSDSSDSRDPLNKAA